MTIHLVRATKLTYEHKLAPLLQKLRLMSLIIALMIKLFNIHIQ